MEKSFGIIITIIVIMSLLCSCWPVPVSHIQKSLQRSSLVPPAFSSVISNVAFCLHTASNFLYSPVFYHRLELYLIPLQSLNVFIMKDSHAPCCSLSYPTVTLTLSGHPLFPQTMQWWPSHSAITVSSRMEEMPSQNAPVQRIKVAILLLDLPCCGLVTHCGNILTTGKFHKNNPDRLCFRYKTPWP